MYIKPELKSYSTDDLLEALGPCQSQYTVTLYTTTGNSSVNVDGILVYSGGAVVSSDTYTNLDVGDVDSIANGTIVRSFIGFDISNIPTGSVIVSATLRVYQVTDPALGTPYSDLDSGSAKIIVDHVNFGTSIDETVAEWSDAITSNIGTISDNATIEVKTLDVRSAVQADLNAGRISSQYRLRFTPNEYNGDGARDDVFFEAFENTQGSGNIPQLVITYR